MSDLQILISTAVIGYLLGSIPFGLVFSYALGIGDIRKIGSGNIGATNVLRSGNKLAAALTFLFDAGKGIVMVLLARYWFNETVVAVAAASVFIGHLFPIWLKFKGGKGVATSAGMLVAIAWPAGLCVAATWLTVFFTSRYSSLAALCGATVAPIAMYFLSIPLHAELALFLAVMVFLMHAQNIRRLLSGTESRFSFKKSG